MLQSGFQTGFGIWEANSSEEVSIERDVDSGCDGNRLVDYDFRPK